MTFSNYEKERQLIIKSMHSSYFSKHVLAKNVSVLIKDKTLNLIGKTIIRYYSRTDEPITINSISLLLEQRLNLQAKRTHAEIPPQVMDELNKEVSALFDSKEDNSELLLNELQSYVRTQLANEAILEEASKGEDNISERVAKRLDEINDINLSGTKYKPLDVLEDVERKLELYKNFGGERVTSGLPSFDRVTGGGLEKGQIALFGAKSGGGKSAALSNLSYYYMMKGHNNVLHISLEELEQDQNLRFDRIMMDVSIKEVFDNYGRVKEDYLDMIQRFYSNLTNSEMKNRIFFEKSTPLTLTVDDVKQMIEQVERNNNIKIDVVVLDYADLLKRQGYSDNEAKSGELLFQDLVKMAQQTQTLVITATQLNRGAGLEDVATLANVEGSYRKINTVAFAATLNSNSEERKQGYVRWYIDKVRNGYWKDDDFLYFKYNTKSMRLIEENDSQKAEHKTLAMANNNSQANAGNKKAKIDKKVDLATVINEAIGN